MTTTKEIKKQIIDNIIWFIDEYNNQCSVEYFGGEEEAQKALASLENCYNCINCSYCRHCSDCRHCSGCINCSDCSYCSDCSDKKGEEENRVIIPKIENIHQKIYEVASKEGALNMDKWHSCETTHCRAGWVVHLAGKEGKDLEERFHTPLAALMIYRKSSDLWVGMNDFYDKNDLALRKMKGLAEQEVELLTSK